MDTDLQRSFVYKHIVETRTSHVPDDANKLRISGDCLEALATKLSLPPAFIFALSRHYLPNGRGTRRLQLNGATAFDFWYILPVRVQVVSGVGAAPDHDTRRNQMDPFNKLQLADHDIEIHRSCIGIFCRTDASSRRTVFVTFDYMHGGKGPKVALEPKERIDEVVNHNRGRIQGLSSSIHLVYLSSAARWWTNTLHSVNMQLITHESKLQTELDNTQLTAEVVLQGINKGLHSIAAHLHRYQSELKSLEGTVTDLSTHHDYVECSEGVSEGSENGTRGFSQVLSQIEACHDFANELEKKAQNILALVISSRIEDCCDLKTHNILPSYSIGSKSTAIDS